MSLLLATPLALAPAAAKPTLTMIDLGTLGGNSSAAVAINDRTQVVGSSTTASGQTHAFLWEDGTMIDLGTLGGNFSQAVAINDRGWVVGTSTTAAGQTHAFLWQDGSLIDLGTLGGPTSSARAINKHGWVIGTSTTAAGQTHAFLWKDGAMIDLGTLGGSSSIAYAINDRGQVVGSSFTASGCERAFLWEDGVMTNLGLPSSFVECNPFNRTRSEALAINDRGQVVGYANNGGNDSARPILWEGGAVVQLASFRGQTARATAINRHGQVLGKIHLPTETSQDFLWEDGVITPLGSLGGAPGVGRDFTYAAAINDRGQVIGISAVPAPFPEFWRPHAFLWEDGVMIDLGTLGGRQSSASGINNHGQVVGASDTASGERHAFLASK